MELAWQLMLPVGTPESIVSTLRAQGVSVTVDNSTQPRARRETRARRCGLVVNDLSELDECIGTLERKPCGWDVFLSYERAQEQQARALYNHLTGLGLRVFFDLTSISGGGQLHQTLEEAANTCRSALVLAPDGWGCSGWAVAEYEILLSRCRDEGLPLALIVLAGAVPRGLPSNVPHIVLNPSSRDFSEMDALVSQDWATTAPVIEYKNTFPRSRSIDETVHEMELASARGDDAVAAGLAVHAESLGRGLPGAPRLMLLDRLVAALLRGDLRKQCRAILEEAWSLAESLDAPRTSIAINLAIVHSFSRSPSMEQWFDIAFERAEAEHNAELAASACANSAVAAIQRGDFERSIALLEPLRTRWTAGHTPSKSVQVLLTLAVAYRNTGRGREARELLEETIFRARATRDRVTEAAAEFELGALVDDVEPSQALAHYAHSHALAVATNDRLGQVRALTQRAVTLARIGRVEEAHVALHAGQALDPGSPLVEWAAQWLVRFSE